APFAHCLTSHALSALLFATPAPAAARTSDVSAAVARASALGGSVLMQDTNHPWAVIQDPQGAAFGLIPVVDAVGDLAASRRRVEEEGGTVLKARSEEHTSELQSRENLVCRLLLEKKKKNTD